MKHFYTCLLLILGVALLNSFGLTVKADDGPTPVNSSLSPEKASVPCMAGEPVHVSLSCFRLSADSGSLLHDMTLQASVLPLQGGAMMHSGMHNVSDGGDGVRLLPGGTHFAEQSPALITLAYNPMRIPAGYTANDIYTYCCEQTGAQWYRLERIGIDTVAHTVSSLTTHFTDFANAVISVPDLPESNAYVPTTLTDIPDPDPLHGIPMVHVNGLNSFGSPTGDNSGSASLTYPIDIPAGRHGLQPDVNLYYNSANGNGPLGVGWSIPTPNVTVDTRWGVPRYNAAYETEAYLVNGEPIVRHDHHDEAIPLPHQSSQFLQRNFQTERFWFRDTRNATRVIRHGRFPNEYWWEVTTTNGITYYYGRTFDPTHPDHDAIDENSVLRGMYGNIGYWALTAMVDLYGNYVLYKNSKHCGLAPYSDGCNIYTDSILYTGNCQVGTAPTYAVELVWMNRNDVISDGRLGLLRLTDRLLCHVDVTYRDTVIGSYYMNYECSANSMWKNRLISIDKSDELGTQRDCNYLEHNLPYYQEYAGSRTTFGYRDAPQDVFGTQSQISNSNTHINKSTSGSWNIGGTATVGIGPMPFNTNFSAGGNYNYSQNYNQIESMLLDLNGDGLPDLVYKAGNVVKYRPQQNSGGFGSEVTVSGLSRLSRDVSRTHNWGLQVSFVGALSYSNPITLSYTDYYFSDINADGLPDMVTPDGILFNHLTPQGHPSFSPYTGNAVVAQHNTGCPDAGIHYTGTIDERLDCEVQEVAVDSLPIGDMHDPGWTEPVFQDDPWHESGELVPYHWDPLPTGNRSVPEQTEQHDAADSYRANANITSSSEETTPASHTSDDMDDVPDLGNRVFFEDGYTYRVERGKIIKYGIETICHDDNPDPIIETVRVWVAEESDTIQVSSSVSLLEDNSVSRQNSRKVDGVRCIIQRNTGNHANGTRFTNTNATILHADTIAADDHDPKTYASSDIIMEAGDMLLFRLCSGNNASFDSVNWNISIQYSNTSGTHFSNSAEDYICTGNRSFAAPLAGEAIIRYKADNDYSTPISLSFAGSGKPAVILAANSSTNGAYIAFDTISMQQGDTIKPVVGNANTVWSHVHIYPEIEFHYQFTNPATNQPIVDTTFFYPDVDYPCSVISTNNVYRYLFGKLHKGWGRFAYRHRNNSNILDLCSLVNTERQAQLQATQSGNTWQNYTLPDSAHVSSVNLEYMNQDIFSYNHLYNPIDTNNTWIPVYPDSRTERWIPYGNLGYISKTGQSNSRNTYPTPQLNRAEQQMAAVGVSSEGDLPYYDSAIPLSDGTNTGRNKTIRKSTRSVQHSFSGGAVIMNASNTWGTYSVETDFMDLNGDGFPDAVGPSGVQYSLPWGGLGMLLSVGIDGHTSSNSSTGANLSATVALMKKIAGNNVKWQSSAMDGSGVGGSHNEGTDQTDRTFVDMNGDGLPDIVSLINSTVRYNLGYRFTAPKVLPADVAFINNSESNSSGANLGANWIQTISTSQFALSQYSISGGVDVSASKNITNAQLTDINGDGLPDLVTRRNGIIKVAYNTGSAFATETSLSMNSPLQRSLTWNIGATVSGTLGFSLAGAWKACFGLQGGGGYSETRSDTAFVDMNADGTLDYVTYDGSHMWVRYNRMADVNLLTTVTNPTGQQISLNYGLSSPSPQHRQRQWVLGTIVDTDAANPWSERQSVQTKRNYANPYYDNHERTDYGYSHITTKEADIRATDESYLNNNYLQRGLKSIDLLMNHHDAPYIGHRYSYAYCGTNGNPVNTQCEDANMHVLEESICTDYYEGDTPTQITTRVRMRYDLNHNLKEYFDDGDIAINDDDWRRTVTYMPTAHKNLVSLPIADSVMTSGGTLLRLRYATWYNTGRLQQMKAVDPQNGMEALTSLFYNSYGNLVHYRLPANENNERANYTIQYENDLKALPAVVTNHFGEMRQTFYNPRWGLPVRTIDPDGAEITYTYDYMGRLTHVLAPQEADAWNNTHWLPDGSNVPYTIRYTYNNISHNLADLNHDTIPHTYVLKQTVTQYEHEPTDEAAIYSARGELLQKKKYTEVFGHPENLTDGIHKQDALGRVVRTRYPSISSTALWLYDDSNNSTGGGDINILYDILDRDTLTLLPDGAKIRKQYNFGKDCEGLIRLSEIITDPLNNSTRSITAPQGWLMQTMAADNSRTCYKYNAIGELDNVMDADGYSTYYYYNGFGQLKERKHPDAGGTKMRYDAAGNLICTQTANQMSVGDSTTYFYNFDRLMEIQHHMKPWENTTFNYDYAGRLALREDRTGSERMWYDDFGNVRKTYRRIIVPGDYTAYQFMTNYVYDSFGRICQMTYPDGENVNYSYYTEGGNLYRVQGCSIQVNDLKHDELGHLVYKYYGNSCNTHYYYDHDRQWMKFLQTSSYADANTMFQDLCYKYDAVGNIIQINQNASQWHSMGGGYTDEYFYDHRYRLAQNLHSDGYTGSTNYKLLHSPTTRIGRKYSDNPAIARPDLVYGYDVAGYTHQPRVVHDIGSGQHLQLYWDKNGNLRQIQPFRSYPRFHMWDDDNQMLLSFGPTKCGYYGNASDGKRAYKLTGTCTISSVNGGAIAGTAYFENVTLYPNPYITLTEDGYTKHYFMGADRIGTTIGGGNGGNWLVNPIDHQTSAEYNMSYNLKGLDYPYYYNGCYHYDQHYDHTTNTDYTGQVDYHALDYADYQYLEDEATLGQASMMFNTHFADALAHYYQDNLDDKPYYYHSDHLGSAAWITDANGCPVQYIMYAPYGEQLLNQLAGTYKERFTFTGKERDTETGYTHYDARKLSDIFGIWLSPDPLLDKYIYNSPYVYCNGNPIKFVDPDGRIIRFASGTSSAQKAQFWQAIRHLDSHNCGGRFGQLKKSRYTYIINMNVEKSQFKPNEQTINWLPDQGIETDNGTIMSPATVLNHEMTHATHYDNAVEQYNKGNTQAFKEYNNSLLPNTSENYDSLEEESVITGIEQRTAQALGEVESGQVTRTNHTGKPVKVESPISNKKVEE